MENQTERLTTSISIDELERRWNKARDMMRSRKIDFLLMRNDEEFLGGYVKWFSDFPARHSYPFTVIFSLDEEMTTIASGPKPPGDSYPPQWAARGVKQRLAAPYFPSMYYTSTYDAELAVEVLNQKKEATIGLVGTSFIPMNFFEYLKGHLPGCNFVDATDEIDQIKAVKSAEELDLITRTAALQDAAIEHLRKTIRPGMRDFEVMAEAQYSVVKQGSEQQLILVCSAPSVSPVRYQFRHFQNRMIKEGDRVSVLIEVNGPGGMYAEIGRTFSIGNPSQELEDAFGVCVEAQELSVNLLQPGVEPKEISQANDDFLEKRGFFPERRLYAHGQGYDLVERPAIRDDEPMKIQAGMNITVHPFAGNKKIWTTICDNYIVTETGVISCLHQTPKEIIVI